MAKTKNPALEERRRAQVIDTCRQLMTRSSYKAMTMDKVAQAAGVSKGLINYYFKSKDDLIIETIRAYHAHEAERLMEVVADESQGARDRLVALVQAVFPSREAVAEDLRFQIEVRSYAKTRPEAWDAIAASYRSLRLALEALLHKGKQEGYVTAIHNDTDLSWSYLFFHSLVNGLSFQVALDEEIEIEPLRQRLIEHIDRMVGAPEQP